MSRELKALWVAVAAGLAAVGLSLALAAAMHAVAGTPPEPTPLGVSSPATASSGSQPHTIPAGTGPAPTGQGLYNQNCSTCHGANAQGGFGPGLQHSRRTSAQLAQVIRKGRGAMPSFAGKLTDPQIESVVAYLASLK